jgi:hypothetical protein
MPLSLLLANSANMATAQIEYAGWFRDDITPEAKWITAIINEQLLYNTGLRLECRPEQSEPAQEEEVQRAQAFQTYVNALAGHPKAISIAAQIVGVDLPAGMEYDELDTKPVEPEPMAEPEPVEEVEEEVEEDDDELPAKAWDELNTWRKKAVRYAKRGKAATFDFTVEHIPADIADAIRKRLTLAGTPDEVKSAFEIGHVEDNDIKMLADAINKAVEAEVKAEPMQPIINITMSPISLTAQMPEQQAAQVTVNVPEQPPPTVEVKVQVPEQPAPVVNVAAPEVKIDNVIKMPAHKPLEATLETDPRTGKKTLRAK